MPQQPDIFDRVLAQQAKKPKTTRTTESTSGDVFDQLTTKSTGDADYSPEAMARVSQQEAQQRMTGPNTPLSQAATRQAAQRHKSLEGLYELGHGGMEPPPDWKPPENAAEARGQLNAAVRRYGSVELALYSMGIPGPGKAASVAGQVVKGALTGGATSAGLYAGQSAIRGKFPDLEGTGEAFAVGAGVGAIAEPMLQLPGVRRAIGRIPALKKFLPPSEEEKFAAQMEAKAQDLMRRGKEQEVLDLKQAMAARRATSAALREAKERAAAVEAAKFKPSEATRRNMGHSPGAYSPEETAPSYAGKPQRRMGTRTLPVSPESSALDTNMVGSSGVRPSISEARVTELIRKPVLTPDEAKELERALGPKWKVMRGKGLIQHQAEVLGLVRARRAAQGMPEPN